MDMWIDEWHGHNGEVGVESVMLRGFWFDHVTCTWMHWRRLKNVRYRRAGIQRRLLRRKSRWNRA